MKVKQIYANEAKICTESVEKKTGKNMTQRLPYRSLYSITETARAAGISPDTLRRWEKRGRIKSTRAPGGKRYFSPQDIEVIKEMAQKHTPYKDLVTIKQAAKILGVSIDTLRRWGKQGLVESFRTPGGHRRYQIGNLKKPKTIFRQPIIQPIIPVSPPTRQEAPVIYQRLHADQEKVVRFFSTALGLTLIIFLVAQTGKADLPGKVLSTLSDIISPYQSTLLPEKALRGQVLQATDVANTVVFTVNVDSTFKKDVAIEGDLTLAGSLVVPSLRVTGAGTFGGDVAVNGGDLTTTATTFNLANTTATTVNVGGAATTLSLGASSGTTTVKNGLTINGKLTASGDVAIKGVTYTFPTSQGSSNTYLKNNGSGTLSWSSVTTDLSSATGTLDVTHGGTGSTTAFTAGSVIFSDGTKLTEDNTNFFWDDTNNRLGIGTSSPAYALQVAGNIAVNSTYSILPNTNLGSDLGSSSLRFNNLYVATINSNATLDQTGQAVFTYDPTDTTYTQASVLINPTSPAANEIMLGLGYGGYEKAGVDREGDLVLGYSNLVTAPTSDNPLRIYNHGSTLLATIDTSGNFGLNNSSPSYPLDVVGSAALHANFSYQRAITLTNGGGTLTNYDVLVEVDTATPIGAGKMQSDCDDIRFTDTDKLTPLSFWIEQGCNTAATQIWVRIPSIPSGSEDIYLSYGNSSAASSSTPWTGKFIIMSNAACPAGWTSVSDVGGVLNAKFPQGSATYGGTGGASSHSHTFTGNTNSGGSGMGCMDGGVSSPADISHTHSANFTSNSSDHLPTYLDVVYCSKTAPIDNFSSQYIIMYGTLPSGWSNYTALNSKFARGAASYGGNGGADTHANSVPGTNTGGASYQRSVWGGGATGYVEGHTHSFSGTLDAATHLPPYTEYIPATVDSGTNSFENTAISIFDVAPPMGWARTSSLDSKFVRGYSSSGGTGGATTHTHSFSFNVPQGGTSTTMNSGGSANCSAKTHTHTVSGSTSVGDNNNLPPYLNVLYYTRNTSSVTAAVGSESSNTGTNPVDFYYNSATSRVGVGATTPLWKFQVKDLQTATASAMIENVANISSYNPTALIIRLGNDSTNPGTGDRFVNFMRGDSTIVGKIQGNGSGAILYTSSGTDFAEYFEKSDPVETFSPGDLVCSASTGKVTKCDSTNTAVVGAVTDRAGFAGGDREGDSNYILVGLLGQLPIKVASGSGEIKAGDALAASSFPGVAEKATSEGYIIGRALEDPVPGVERLLTYINPTWYNPKVSLSPNGEIAIKEDPQTLAEATVSATPTSPLNSANLADILAKNEELMLTQQQFATYLEELRTGMEEIKTDLSLVKADLLTSQSLPDATSSGTLTQTAVLADVVVSGKLNVGGLIFDSTTNSLDAIGVLRIQSLALGSIEFQNDSIEMDTNGNLLIKKGIIIANANLRNSETLPAGEKSLTVTRTWERPPTSITATPNYNTRIWITDKSENGFTVNVETPPAENATIDWFAIW